MVNKFVGVCLGQSAEVSETNGFFVTQRLLC